MSDYSVTVRQSGRDTVVEGITCFALADTLDCGQAFRWSELEDGRWSAIAHGRLLTVGISDGCFILYDTDTDEFEKIWRRYFDLDRDYSEIIKAIEGNEILKAAGDYGKGIRLLRQDPWETLCSFIISQNNNIPRIKGIIDRLCEGFGDKIEGGYTFPSADRLAGLTVEDLAPLRSGFRAKYIIDAAEKIASGEISLESLDEKDCETAAAELMKIKGVGPKVADCALLFGLGKIDCFPKDVWIKRAMSQLFDGQLPECAVPYAGIVQQYIFHYSRTSDIFADKKDEKKRA